MGVLFDTKTVPQTSLADLAAIFRSIGVSGATSDHLLVLQHSISRLLDTLASFSTLKKVTKISKVVWIDEQNFDHEHMETISSSIVFLCDGGFEILDAIAGILKRKILPFNRTSKISLIVANRLPSATDLAIENLGIKGDVKVYHWSSLRPIALESDILDLCLPQGGLGELFSGSINPLDELAGSLLDLVINSGYKVRITNTFIKGEHSSKLWNIYQNKYQTHLTKVDPKTKKRIQDQDETLFVDQHSFFNRNVDFVCLDRSVDLVSAVLTQLTYTGLCHETLGVQLGMVSVPEENLKLRFGDFNDEIYQLVRDLNFSMVGSVLNSKARTLQVEYDKRNNLTDIEEMKKFVGELNKLKESQKCVQKHTVVAESILKSVKDGDLERQIPGLEAEMPTSNKFNAFVELQQEILSDSLDNKRNCAAILEYMYQFEPPLSEVLRLMILTSIVKRGVREPEYEHMKTEIYHMYGMDAFKILLRMKELKMVYPRESLSFLPTSMSEEVVTSPHQLIRDFSSIGNGLNLMPVSDQVDPANPQDADFGLPGYVPIITRLIEAIYSREFLAAPRDMRVRKYGWDNLDLSALDGELRQEFLVPETKKSLFNSTIPPKASQLADRKDLIIVTVVGGMTYSEISTIRFVLNKNPVTKSKQVIFLTPGIITGVDLIDSLRYR
ncbi:hypothetical protein KL929_004480 [Ogataea haglerorum]|uniref:uncharacterized protein n=1 Tax=Ogataea haglerorum TaxID=1937702 RepID=UPI001C8ABDA3|nr:uncharacterized protein KL911_000503 [Ogataea haglerorum]KAG7746285.1 hypothetical protein KL912_004545 [Ogataea haglerorum]KAG7759366.1 hypothetical protein KL911_000503 [Ogataea haglerorum]KAG7771011.1 hypothetical protein KL931_001833 [Ogataea haglerorum]KAG7795015.1 hypothetical protein KL929_004480 [Ogataea haglerorum]KAG7803659.1 hypothetical protein KL944_001612 [Ogataea haglerorum]